MRQKKGLITFFVFSILLTSLFMNDLEVDVVSGNLPEEIVPPGQDDLQITLEANQTTIGKNGGVKANLTLFNNGINPVSNVQVDFGFDGEYTEFTDTYPEHQSAVLINSGFGTSMFIEVILNETIELGNISSSSADVCIVIDGSGSMRNEIDQVKAEFLTITNNLVQQIPDLRIGAMVYGCVKFGSEYPQEAPGNYVEFTSDFTAVNDFIMSLEADGGIEPWGDALAFANTWDWRDDTPKLLIIVGDEDCDPGHLVGVGETGSYYNGSQLLDAVTNLKEKEIKINSVRTGPDSILENQFRWIAEYTGGESVNLDEMQSLPDPVDLPELIETWTLELAREYFVNLYANVSWTENDPMGDVDYETSVSIYIIVDLAPPSIAVSTLTTIQADLTYQLDIYVTPEDLSGILTTILYWTDDDLDLPIDPTWHFEILTDEVENTYLKSFTNLNEGDKLSFYVIAIDILGNQGETVIYNETITISVKDFGTTTPILFTEDNSTTIVHFNLDLETIGYLWVEANDEIIVEVISVDFLNQELISESEYNIYKITKIGSDTTVAISIKGNTSTEQMKLHWNFIYEISNEIINTVEFLLSSSSHPNNHLLKITVLEDGVLSIRLISPQLIPHIQIFDANWNYIDTLTPTNPVDLTPGSYHLWAERVYRDGYFGLYFGDEEYSYTDPYYTWSPTAPGNTIVIVLCVLGFLSFITLLTKRRKLRKEV